MEGKVESVTNMKSSKETMPRRTVSGSVRFFLMQPVNLLLFLLLIHLLSARYTALMPAQPVMSAGIFGASFGFASYSRREDDSWPWGRALIALAALDALGLLAGYAVALFALMAGVTGEESWAYLPLLFVPLILADFATPFVVKRIVGPAEVGKVEEESS